MDVHTATRYAGGRRHVVARLHQFYARGLQHDPRLSARRRPGASRDPVVDHRQRRPRHEDCGAYRTGVGFVLIVFGLFRFLEGAGLGGLWMSLIGWFLLEAARASVQMVQSRAELQM